MKISLSKIIIYAFLAAIIPALFILWELSSNFEKCTALEERIQINTEKAALLSPLLKKHVAHRRGLENRDPNFVNSHLETFIPLSHEIDSLKERSQRGFLPDEDAFKRRLEFLTSGQNTITFVESGIQTNNGIKETVESQTKPIEMNGNDVCEFLERIEGAKDAPPYSKRPHLQFLECRIERKKQTNGSFTNEVYLFTSKLLKQECIE